MIADSRCAEIELICAIVNYGLGSKVIKVARECGVSGGTITLGKGTINSRILDFLGLSDVRKEIVFLVTDESTASVALEELNKKFEFHRLTMDCLYDLGMLIMEPGFGLWNKGDECEDGDIPSDHSHCGSRKS